MSTPTTTISGIPPVPIKSKLKCAVIGDARQREGVRGPGIVFVNPRFDEHNAVFASDSFVYGDYDPPKDPLADDRMSLDPRGIYEGTLLQLLAELKAGLVTVLPVPATLEKARLLRRRLLLGELMGIPKLRGPLPLVAALGEEDDDSVLLEKQKREELIEQLKVELLRLRMVRIASILHPNVDGAKRYAKRIVEDVLTYQYEESESSYEALVTSLSVSISDDPLPTRAQAMRAFGLDPNAPRGEIMQMIRPDIITLTILGAKPPENQTGTSLTLRHFSGNSPAKSVALTILYLPAEQTTILTGDAGGRYNLGYYKRCLIAHTSWAAGHTVRMYVNGRRVLDTKVTTTVGTSLELPYPAPITAPVGLPLINPAS